MKHFAFLHSGLRFCLFSTHSLNISYDITHSMNYPAGQPASSYHAYKLHHQRCTIKKNSLL